MADSAGGGPKAMDVSPDAPPPAATLTDQEKKRKAVQGHVQQRFKMFLNQLVNGCGREECTNTDCASCKAAPTRPQKQAIQRALQLVKKKSKLCKEDSPGSPRAEEKKTEVKKEKEVVRLGLDSLRDVLQKSKEDQYRGAIRLVGDFFSDRESLSHGFFDKVDGADEGSTLSQDNPALDVEELHAVVDLLEEQEATSNAFHGALSRLCNSMSLTSSGEVSLRLLRSYHILLQIRSFLDPSYHDTYKLLIKSVTTLPAPNQNQLGKWMSTYTTDHLDNLVGVVQQYITVRWYITRKVDETAYAVKTLKILHHANTIKEENEQQCLPYDIFYNDAVNAELDMSADFVNWRKGRFSFAAHPFVLDPAAKAKLLQFDSEVQMRQQFNEVMWARLTMMQAPIEPYLILRIRRTHILEDSLRQIQQQSSGDLKKPLKVKFEGEAGIDEGGVQKEFFQLLIAELFDPKFGMLLYDEETRTLWFNKTSLDSPSEFELMGNLLGLAIYNSVILDTNFPHVVYKKLVHAKVGLKDVIATMPGIGKGLHQLLTFDGDVAETYMRQFCVSYECFGETKVDELKEGGKDISLTKENREEYVELYVDYLLNKSIDRQWKAFSRGFYDVCDGEPFKMFRAEELELLICGSPDLDFDALEESTRYEDGFTPDSPVIKNFWEIVHAMTIEEKKKFLCFCTGSDRVPIKGLGGLVFTISKNGPDSDRLPTSHTCFNHLLLPEYDTKEKLQRSILLAIENSKGFGLM